MLTRLLQSPKAYAPTLSHTLFSSNTTLTMFDDDEEYGQNKYAGILVTFAPIKTSIPFSVEPVL